MHAAVEAGVHGLELLHPLQLRAASPLLLLRLGVETLVPAAQHSLQVAAHRGNNEKGIKIFSFIINVVLLYHVFSRKKDF